MCTTTKARFRPITGYSFSADQSNWLKIYVLRSRVQWPSIDICLSNETVRGSTTEIDKPRRGHEVISSWRRRYVRMAHCVKLALPTSSVFSLKCDQYEVYITRRVHGCAYIALVHTTIATDAVGKTMVLCPHDSLYSPNNRGPFKLVSLATIDEHVRFPNLHYILPGKALLHPRRTAQPVQDLMRLK